MASKPIYQFYVELDDYSPKIWRRFQVFRDISMARLGYIIMTLFEMRASHLFNFEVDIEGNMQRRLSKMLDPEELAEAFKDPIYDKPLRFEVQNDLTQGFDDEEAHNATEHKVKDVIYDVGDQLIMTYDFGDNWELTLTLEEIIKDKDLPGREIPRVIAGEGHGIIEDCGGTPGLEQLAEVFKHKQGEQYEHYSAWLGIKNFDLAQFDIHDMNFRLKKVPRIYAEAYEYSLEPTKRSLDILARKYLQK